MTSSNEMIISIEHYIELVEDQMKLHCLERCGVDDWEGWDDAMDMLHKLISEKQEIEIAI